MGIVLFARQINAKLFTVACAVRQDKDMSVAVTETICDWIYMKGSQLTHLSLSRYVNVNPKDIDKALRGSKNTPNFTTFSVGGDKFEKAMKYARTIQKIAAFGPKPGLSEDLEKHIDSWASMDS